MQKVLMVMLLLFFAHGPAVQAEEYQHVEVKKLLTSRVASNGQPLSYIKTDTPEVTALIVRFPPGGSTGWHQHPVPVYAYVLEGTLTVALKDGHTFTFNKGDAILEVMNTFHNGTNYGREPVSLVVFYTGAAGTPNVVKEEVFAPAALPRK